MRPFICIMALAASACLLQSCSLDMSPSSAESPESWQHHLKSIERKDLASYPKRQRVYVPVYSHIYTDDRDRVLNLAETLSVRNTDDANALVITSVSYRSNTGKLIREYVPKPIILDPMAAADFVVRLDDTSGGSGASFTVDLQSVETLNPPLVEAVMISTGSGKNLSFVSRAVALPPGKPVSASEKEKTAPETEPAAESSPKEKPKEQ